MASVIGVPGIDELGAGDLVALNDAATSLGIPVDWLATVISFETAGSFSPSRRNDAGSGAFGLIQFMPDTAARLLKMNAADAVDEGISMSFEQQMRRMVIPYLRGRRYDSLADVYLVIFYPAAMNKPDDYAIGAVPSAVYHQNAGFDRNNDSTITRGEVVSAIESLYRRSQSAPRVTIPLSFVPRMESVMGAALGLGAVYVAMRVKPKWFPKRYRLV